MPDVGGTKFPYSKEGIAKAKAWAEMTGKPIKIHGQYYRGGDIPMYGLGGWLKKAAKKAKKAVKKVSMKGLKEGWDKNIKHGAITEGLRDFDKEHFGGRLSKAVTLPERYKGMSFKHMQKMKPLDFAALASLGLGGGLGLTSMLANKAQKMYGSKGLSGDISPAGPDPYVDPNLFGARQRFGSGSGGIAELQAQLMGGGMEQGGEVPAGRRMYATGGKTKRRKK